MRLTSKMRDGELNGKNVRHLQEMVDEPLGETPYFHLLHTIALVLDEAAQGRNVYMTLGTTRSKDAYSFTINDNGDRAGAYATALAALCLEAARLVEP